VFEQSRDVKEGFADLGESDKTINQNRVKNPERKTRQRSQWFESWTSGWSWQLVKHRHKRNKSCEDSLETFSFEIQNQILKDESQTGLASIFRISNSKLCTST
jgi:hypothetical protein